MHQEPTSSTVTYTVGQTQPDPLKSPGSRHRPVFRQPHDSPSVQHRAVAARPTDSPGVQHRAVTVRPTDSPGVRHRAVAVRQPDSPDVRHRAVVVRQHTDTPGAVPLLVQPAHLTAPVYAVPVQKEPISASAQQRIVKQMVEPPKTPVRDASSAQAAPLVGLQQFLPCSMGMRDAIVAKTPPQPESVSTPSTVEPPASDSLVKGRRQYQSVPELESCQALVMEQCQQLMEPVLQNLRQLIQQEVAEMKNVRQVEDAPRNGVARSASASSPLRQAPCIERSPSWTTSYAPTAASPAPSCRILQSAYPAYEFQVTIDRSQGQPHGLRLQLQDDSVTVVDIDDNVLVSQQMPEVRVGDRLIEVNNVTNPEMMLDACDRDQVLNMSFSREASTPEVNFQTDVASEKRLLEESSRESEVWQLRRELMEHEKRERDVRLHMQREMQKMQDLQLKMQDKIRHDEQVKAELRSELSEEKAAQKDLQKTLDRTLANHGRTQAENRNLQVWANKAKDNFQLLQEGGTPLVAPRGPPGRVQEWHEVPHPSDLPQRSPRSGKERAAAARGQAGNLRHSPRGLGDSRGKQTSTAPARVGRQASVANTKTSSPASPASHKGAPCLTARDAMPTTRKMPVQTARMHQTLGR